LLPMPFTAGKASATSALLEKGPPKKRKKKKGPPLFWAPLNSGSNASIDSKIALQVAELLPHCKP